MKNLTLNKIKEEKEKLQNKISELMDKFEEKTSTKITGILIYNCVNERNINITLYTGL